MIYITIFKGDFGFIKPWSAVRDSKTRSNYYLSPSILMGIEIKIFPELLKNENGKLNKIMGYRLSFLGTTWQQESTKSINFERKIDNRNKNHYFKAQSSIINRGYLLYPELYLIFNNAEDANIAMEQHVCLCKNEDILLPIKMLELNSLEDFNEDYPGYESVESDETKGIYCGLNQYTGKKQYIEFRMIGEPGNLKE